MKTAAFAHRLDTLFLPASDYTDAVHYLVPKDHMWLRTILKGKKTIIFETSKKLPLEDLSDEDIIKSSNVTALLKSRRITAFLTSHQGSHRLKRWASVNAIRLIGTRPDDQIFYENKIQFDRLMKKIRVPSPESRIVRGGIKPFQFPFVVQEPSSFGTFGTHIVRTKDEWDEVRGLLNPHRIYLARKYLEGAVYGVTIYIDDFRIALSALRRQCYFENSAVFAGIQWERTGSFKKKHLELLNRTLLHLGLTLQDRGFFGFANIDFILSPEEGIFFLECNPRLSSASPQLFGVPETFGNVPVADLYLSGGDIESPPPFFFFPIPNSNFEGALLDVITPVNRSSECITGTYIGPPAIEFESPDIPDLASNAKRFLYYGHSNTGKIRPGEQTGTVISSFRLFNGRGTLNRAGSEIFARFTE